MKKNLIAIVGESSGETELSTRLTKMKKEVITISSISIQRKKITQVASRAFKKLESYDWVIFTSRRAVEFFAQELQERQVTLPKNIRVAAVGPNTAKVLRTMHFKVHSMPAQFTVKDLIENLGSVKGLRILFPRSSIAPKDVVRDLRARGAEVTVLSLYTTTGVRIPHTKLSPLIHGDVGYLTFMSPSGIDGLFKNLSASEKTLVRNINAVCIGPRTAEALKKSKFKKVIVAKSFTNKGIAEVFKNLI